MVKHSVVCICLFALMISVNALKSIDETKAEIQKLDKTLIEKLNQIDQLEKKKVQELDDTVHEDLNKETKEFETMLKNIEDHAEIRHKRQTQQQFDMSSIMSNPALMQQLQMMMQQQQPAQARSTFQQQTAPAARSTLQSGLAPFEKMRLAPFTAIPGIRKLAYGGADPTASPTLNANGNPLPNTCARGFSEPIWEGFQITESYCRCPGDESYGFTCAEGFGNPCAGNDQQFFPADARIPNTYFVHCSNYVPYLKKCPAGLVWDQSLTTCNWPASEPAVGAAPGGYGGSSYAAPVASAAPSYASPVAAAAPSYASPVAAAAPSYAAPAVSAPSYAAPAVSAPSYSAPAPAAAAPSYSSAPVAAAAPSGYGGYSNFGGR